MKVFMTIYFIIGCLYSIFVLIVGIAAFEDAPDYGKHVAKIIICMLLELIIWPIEFIVMIVSIIKKHMH
jgi:hypothetical protein